MAHVPWWTEFIKTQVPRGGTSADGLPLPLPRAGMARFQHYPINNGQSLRMLRELIGMGYKRRGEPVHPDRLQRIFKSSLRL